MGDKKMWDVDKGGSRQASTFAQKARDLGGWGEIEREIEREREIDR